MWYMKIVCCCKNYNMELHFEKEISVWSKNRKKFHKIDKHARILKHQRNLINNLRIKQGKIEIFINEMKSKTRKKWNGKYFGKLMSINKWSKLKCHWKSGDSWFMVESIRRMKFTEWLNEKFRSHFGVIVFIHHANSVQLRRWRPKCIHLIEIQWVIIIKIKKITHLFVVCI